MCVYDLLLADILSPMQAYNVIAAIVKQRAEPGITVNCRILEVRDTDVRVTTS